MKNKHKTYVLIAAVLVIWGVIAYKISSGLHQNESPLIDTVKNQPFVPRSPIEMDTFSIQNIDRDPFLGTFSKPPKKTKKPVFVPPQPKSLKQIRYSGIVQKTHGKTPVFVVTINNRQYVLKKGQTVDSVTLVSGNANKIVVRYNRQLRTIKRPE